MPITSEHFAGYRPTTPNGGGEVYRPTLVKIDKAALGVDSMLPGYLRTRRSLENNGMQVLDVIRPGVVKGGTFNMRLAVPEAGVAHLPHEVRDSAIEAHVASTVVDNRGLTELYPQIDRWPGRRLYVPHESIFPPSEFGQDVTTRIMTQKKIADKIRGGDVLDMGAGSGILAVAAGLMDARTVTATDLNPIAVESAVLGSWVVNGLPPEKLITVKSDVFNDLPKDAKYNVIITNPPVQPPLYKSEGEEGDWKAYNESSGKDGRGVLDRILDEGPKRLKPGGVLLTTTTSRHGVNDTDAKLHQLLDKNEISGWEIMDEAFVKLNPEQYGEYFDHWLQREAETGEPRIYQDASGDYYHRRLVYAIYK